MSLSSVALVVALQGAPPQAPETLPLDVLYAGNPDTPYSAAWQAFLAAHVRHLRFVAGRTLKRADLAGIDLLVVDGEVEAHDAKGNLQLKSEKIQLRLADLQGLPVVLMGGEGGSLADGLHLKTSWHHG